MLFDKKLILVLMLIWPAAVFAQQDPAEVLIYTPDRLVLPLNQSGSSVTVITRDQIESGFYPFVVDVLRSVPGLFPAQAGSSGKAVSLFGRGTGSSSVLVLIDGVQINNSITAPDVSTISTANVERIEIVRGPFSALYGSGAAGGVINIITRSGGPILSALAEYGSDSTFRGGVRAGFGSDRNNVAVSYDGYNSDGESINDFYRNQTLDFNLRVDVTQWTNVGVHYRNNDSELGIPFFSGISTPESQQETETSLLHIPIRQQITDWWEIDGVYSYLKDEITFQDPGANVFEQAESRTNTYNLSTIIRMRGGHGFIAGIEHEELEIDGTETFDNTAYFGEYRTNIRGIIGITAALRLDDHNFAGSEFSPRISLSYQATPSVRFLGSAAKGFRAPDPREVSGPFGNPEIKSETVKGWDAGIEFHLRPKRVVFSGTFFWNEFDDPISFDFSSRQFINAGESRASGIELSAYFRPAGSFSFDGTYTYLNGKDQATDLELLRRPEHSGSIGIGFRRRRFAGHLRFIFSGERPDISDPVFQRITNSGYTTADAAASYELNADIRAFVRITNIFETTYEEIAGFPAPDRGIFFGLAYR